MNQISFSGHYIAPVNILKKTVKENFIPCNASFVKLDTLNKGDIFALKEIDDEWPNSFADIIYTDAKSFYEKEEQSKFHHFFVVTAQVADFQKIISDKILAVTEISAFPSSKKIDIEALQVHPQHNYWSQERNYKRVGSAFLDVIKQVFIGKEIRLRSLPSALEFYYINGFHPITKGSHDLQFLNIEL